MVNSDLFYPSSVRSAEERLRFYGEQFNTVEVDSSYYALSAQRNAKLWTEPTPDGFIFNIKTFALMTGHRAEVSRLPKELLDMVPAKQQIERQLTRPPGELVDIAFQMFWSALAPLREAGKLGMVAFSRFTNKLLAEEAMKIGVLSMQGKSIENQGHFFRMLRSKDASLGSIREKVRSLIVGEDRVSGTRRSSFGRPLSSYFAFELRERRSFPVPDESCPFF